MSTYSQVLYHIVFSTKDRVKCLSATRREDLFKFIWGVLKNKDCHLYRIGGVEDHVHILCSVHSAISLASLVKDIKVGASTYIKDEGLFSGFSHWQEGYGAFTCSWQDKDGLIEYIKGQEEHHREVTFLDELEALLKAAGVEYDPKYLG